MPQDDPYRTLFDDLKVYDNPEAFTDSNSDGIYRLSLPLPGALDLNLPVIFKVEINGSKLVAGLLEYVWYILKKAPNLESGMSNAGVNTVEELKAVMLADPQFDDAQRAYYWFFVRYFPELANRLILALGILAVGSLATHGFVSEDQRPEQEAILKDSVETVLKGFRQDFKRMLRTRTRGGKAPTIAPDIRASLHRQYESLHQAAKSIKKHHDALYKTYSAQHHRVTQDVWSTFWLDQASQVFSSQPKEFLALFAEIDRPSASEASYVWLARSHKGKLSYIKKLVKESKRILSNSQNESTVPSN